MRFPVRIQGRESDGTTWEEMSACEDASTGGVGLNFILKSGTNNLRGSARVYFENEGMQSNNMDEALATALGSPNGKGNRTDQYADYGFEVGLPIISGNSSPTRTPPPGAGRTLRTSV